MLLLVMMNSINWGLKNGSGIVLHTLNELFHLLLTTPEEGTLLYTIYHWGNSGSRSLMAWQG